jgi:hydroxypyruvate reductase
MAAAAARLLGPRLARGVIIAPQHGDGPFELIAADHPAPGPASERAGRRALALAASTRPGDTLLVLLSGGASALMAVPAGGITLDDKARTADVLMRTGATIDELNGVRKHLSAIKGGRLAVASSGRVLTFAISDVVGDDLSVIGSGPTVPDPTTFAEALGVLARRGLERFPEAVVRRLQAGRAGGIDETPKPGEPKLTGGRASVIGRRHDAMQGAAEEARRRGYALEIREAAVTGEARRAGPERLAEAAASSLPRPACFISSGETTVVVNGKGRGGRNQELALAAAAGAADLSSRWVLASAGTDGIDGPTDAAGAVADSTTGARARERHLLPELFLEDNDAYAFFHALGDLIHSGPTGTNVGDLQIILLA